uniref:Uncharacterized protein LOC114331563 n=4 Tax=Diabrotica virgifera virgifera TaxID=50390 RepID=A0A6P7FVL0_DIAVI
MLSNRLLTEEYERVEVQVNDKIKQADNLSLQCDGWSNLRNESVINFIVTTPEPLFVKSVLTKAEKHTAEYITKLMVEVLEEYGPKKFFAIVTDNAKNMRKAVRQCEEMYPHLVSYGCLAHTLHLLCSDILKLSSIETHLPHIIHIVKTINQCQVLRAQFTEIRNEMKCRVSLSLPVKTRWGSHVKCLQDLTKCKSVLQRLAISPDKTIQDRIRSAKANLLDEGFWINSSALVELLKPITEAITRLEGDSSSIHLVCETFAKIGSNISTHLECVKLKDCEKTEAMDKFISRKEYALQPIHFAADLLNPRSVGANLSSAERIEAMKYITTMSTTTTIEIGDEGVSKITEDLGNYLAKTDFFGDTFLWNILDNVSLVTWWKGFCGHLCLSKVAVRILTMPCTSAAPERSFSSQSSIHTKRRNRLTTQRAANLNYIQYNSKLLKRSRQHHIQSQYPIEETVQNNVSIEGRNLQKEIEVIENHISEEEELDETISSWHSNTTGNGNSDDDFNFADFAMTDDEIDQRMETREQRPARILRQSKVNILENVLMKSGKGTEQPQKKTEVEKDTSDAENKDAVLDLPEIKKITQGSLEEQTIETSTFYNKKVSSCLRKRKL